MNKKILILFLLFLFSNCATFEKPKTFKEFKPDSAKQLDKSTFVILTDDQYDAWYSAEIWKEFNNAIGRKNMFSDFNVYLNSDPDPMDKHPFLIRFDVRTPKKGNYKDALLGIITGLSLGLIPIWLDDTVSYSAEVLDSSSGKILKTFHYENKRRIYVHLFLTPFSAMPKYSYTDLIFEHFLESIYKDGSIPFENGNSPPIAEVIK
ncbi:hypothetical protein JWG44_05300 [Leptospira sp. 201903071]|uniref:hypothetical protein n=1 Tax=Leptospira ainazelensis TaxID=2810034 RepID=UPI001966C39A|nr:hypothetical protein [Leptospira ainazelensis]MBM9499665.1 hypothetical protein [Leptospira ainazelensis]